MTQTTEGLSTHLNLDLLQQSIQQLDDNSLENVAELVFFRSQLTDLPQWNEELEGLKGKAFHALYLAGNLSQIYHTAHGQLYPPQLEDDATLITRQDNFAEEYYLAFLDSPVGQKALRDIEESLEDFEGDFELEDAIYRVKPVIYEVLYPQRFQQLWQQYTSQGQSSFMAWMGAYINLQDEIEGTESRSVVHDAAMEYIKQLGADELGIEAQFIQLGINKNIAVQLTFGALWHEEQAINDGLEHVPSHLKANVLGTVQRLADTTSALFNRIQTEIDPETILAAAQLINGIYAIEQLDESNGRNQALATAYYEFAVMTGCIGSDTPDDPSLLTDAHYATLNHFIRVFCETKRGEAALMQISTTPEVNENRINPITEPGVSQNLFTPISEPTIHSIAIEDMPMLQPPEIRAVLEAPESTLNYIAKQIAKIDTVFRDSALCNNDCLWRIGSALNIINEMETPSPEDLTDADFEIITSAVDFFCEKYENLIEPHRASYRSSSVISVPGKVVDEIYGLLMEEAEDYEPPVQHFRLPTGQVVKMYETVPGHYSISLENPEYTPINQYISAGWEPIDDPGYVGMPPAH